MQPLKQTGDTIVEVLIAVVVVSVVLVGAYTISNASLRQIRISQERGEAQKIAAGQLERLSGCVSSGPTVVGTSIYSVGSSCTANTVEVKVTWTAVNGLPEEVSMFYKVPTP